jgi:kinesin family protein 3/17
MEAERAKLRAEFEEAMNELKAQYQNEQKSKAKLQQDLLALRAEYDRASEEIEEMANRGQIEPQEAIKRCEQFGGTAKSL